MNTATLFDVKDRVVLVTGGGKGIGRMIAEGYVAAGAKCYISSRDGKACAATAAELNAMGKGRCEWIAADLSTMAGVESLVAELSKREKHLNVLVNNAGANWGSPLATYPDAAFSKVITLNLQRVFTLTQKLVPLMLASVHGASVDTDNVPEGPFENPARIINIGSVDGIRVPRLETYAYSASKAALHQLSRVFAAQLGPKGITSNTLACGPFQSKMMAATLAAAGDLVVAGVPLARIGSAEDVAGACLFLSSRAGCWVNGATIALDGGSLTFGKM